jgi:putative redox protein
MEVFVEHLGAVQFEVRARQHKIVCDQPSENGGFDEGMTPPELLLASLASCAGFYAAQYLKKYKLATEGTTVRVTADKLKEPARMDNFHIEVEVPLAVSEQHRHGIEEAIDHCLIHNTLLHPPKITLKITAAAVISCRSTTVHSQAFSRPSSSNAPRDPAATDHASVIAPARSRFSASTPRSRGFRPTVQVKTCRGNRAFGAPLPSFT